MEENKNIEPEQPAENIPEEIISAEANPMPETEEQQTKNLSADTQTEVKLCVGKQRITAPLRHGANVQVFCVDLSADGRMFIFIVSNQIQPIDKIFASLL